MYEFHSSTEDMTGHEDMLEWLSNKNGEFSLMLRDTLKIPILMLNLLFYSLLLL